MPIDKKPGNEAIGATVNQDGMLKIKANKIGKDTFLSQIVKMVEECQGTKVPIQEFADKVTSIFVPIVLGIATLTFLLWIFLPSIMQSLVEAGSFLPWVNSNLTIVTLAIVSVVAVLVIACPCALGLATPTALMVGSGMGAEQGILIRSGEAIQTLKDVQVLVLDKTGTLTKGKPEVTDIIAVNGFTEKDVLYIASSVEQGSEHPLGRAIVERAKKEGVKIDNIKKFHIIRGKGVESFLNGKKVLVGSRLLMKEQGLDSNLLESGIVKLEKEAKTAMLVAEDNALAGVIAVADTLKEDSFDAIKNLHSIGIKTAMLTGDNQRTAKAIADKIGIDLVLAEVLPEGKMEEIQKLQKKFKVVAMVGDGINDAPALKQANVGIAIGTGTDVAIEASDVTLVSGNLSGIVKAINLSHATFRKIKQGLFWAFFYNVVMIPLAIIGWMHPVLAEIAMATSSVSVVTNANLLRKAKIG